MSHIVPRYQQDLEKVEDRENALKMSNLLLKSAELLKKQKKRRFNLSICESPCSDEQEWVYGMCSPAFPGKIKIGRTNNLAMRLSYANIFCAPAPHVYVATVPTLTAFVTRRWYTSISMSFEGKANSSRFQWKASENISAHVFCRSTSLRALGFALISFPYWLPDSNAPNRFNLNIFNYF
jgi:hypothetical protein